MKNIRDLVFNKIVGIIPDRTILGISGGRYYCGILIDVNETVLNVHRTGRVNLRYRHLFITYEDDITDSNSMVSGWM